VLLTNSKLLEFCRPTDDPTIPWEKIESEPNSFYDCRTHQIEHLLGDPALLSIGSIYALAKELSQNSNVGSSNPFQFHSATDQTDNTPSPHLDNLIQMSPSPTSSSPHLLNPTQAVEEPGTTPRIDNGIHVGSASHTNVPTPTQSDSHLTSHDHPQPFAAPNVNHQGDEADGFPPSFDQAGEDSVTALKSPPRHVQPSPSPPLSDLTPPPDATEDVVSSNPETANAGQSLHGMCYTSIRRLV
jgi:hypothetical protein